MTILGINAYHGDSSAALLKDGRLICAIEEERIRRIKHWAGFPIQAIRWCLSYAAIDIREVDYIAISRNPGVHLLKKALRVLKNRPRLSFLRSRIDNYRKLKSTKEILAQEFSLPEDKIPARIINVEHHRAHMASAFFVSGFEKSALVSIDGFGDFVSLMLGIGEANKIKVLDWVEFPHSLGIFYTALTQFLGFSNYGDEYKVMGLSAYGKPVYMDEMRRIVRLEKDGLFRLDTKFFLHDSKGVEMTWLNQRPLIGRLFSDRLVEVLGKPREEDEELSERHIDIASSVQAIYEEAFFHILNYLYRKTGLKNLALAGGCAQNSLANGKITEFTEFKNVYIPPASHDAGGAVGAVFYLWNQILDRPRMFVMESPFWGPEFSREEISNSIGQSAESSDTSGNGGMGELENGGRNEEQRAEGKAGLRIKGYGSEGWKQRAGGRGIEGLKVEELEEDELIRKVAQDIADGKIVGWFQGRTEWGPRALGNRSILADPRRKEMKDVLNARIKKREWFRPFAPSILAERVEDWFLKKEEVPFMEKVYKIRDEKKEFIPAVAHIDGTGRLQTVSEKLNPKFHKLIREFEKLTGVPILLNTSFNENEPIVNAPQDALNCFLRTRMDVLAIGNFYLIRM